MSTGIDVGVRILRTEHVHLAALLSTVGGSRLFVRGICASWQLGQDQTDVMELLTSELVSNAITASGVTVPRPVHGLPYADLQLIGLRLLALDDSFVIEVWDASPRPPRLMAQADLVEHGRGLQLVDALSIRWGYYYAPVGGKVVWCQLRRDDIGETDSSDDEAEFATIQAALKVHTWNDQA